MEMRGRVEALLRDVEMRKKRNPRIEAATRAHNSPFIPFVYLRMVPLVQVQMPFLNWCLVLSRRRGCLVCAAPIHLWRQPGLLPGFPPFGVSGSLRRLRRRVPPCSIGPFELIKLLLSRARGHVNPTPASHETTTTTRTTGVNTRNTEAVPRNSGATAITPMCGELIVTKGLTPPFGGATATEPWIAITTIMGSAFISLRARVRVRKRTKFECALPFPSSFSGSFGFWFLLYGHFFYVFLY